LILINVLRGLSEIVTVISKNGEVIAKVHRELICAQSDFMAGLLAIQASITAKQADKNAPELKLTLPFDEVPLDEEVVAKSLIYWFYRQRIYIPNAVRETTRDSMGSYGLLCKLWVLAEKFQMKSLGNDVVDGIWDLYLVNEYLPYSIIEFVYTQTSEPLSAIRRLLVTIMKLGLDTPQLDELKDFLPKQFFVDLTEKQFDMLDRNYSKTMHKEFCKRFHEHDFVEEEGKQLSECVGIKTCD
jgi:hypothetical protein